MDYQWKYNYNYPPLLVDLVKVGKPTVTKSLFNKIKGIEPLSQMEQLKYIIPPSHWKELGISIDSNETVEKRENIKFVWAFKRYFWESHL